MLKQHDIPIVLSEIPNRHLLIWGQSGLGKTYFSMRKIEDEYECGRKIALIDYSGSYTQTELQKAQFQYVDDVLVLNPSNSPIYWISNSGDIDCFIQESKDALVKALDINSYNQSSLLFLALEYIEEHCDATTFSWSIPKLIRALKELKKMFGHDEKSPDLAPNIERLLTRLAKYESLYNFYVTMQSNDSTESKEQITIFQLSDLPEEHRLFLTSLLSEMLWLEMKRGKSSLNYFETIVYDEFQFLSVKRGSALSHFIREGRKFGVGLILSSQFISHYTEEEQETLLQANNILIFKPTARDLTFSAKIIDFNSPGVWKKILSKLSVGYAILVGNYYINGNDRLLNNPIVCHIEKEASNNVKEFTRCTNSAGCSKPTTCKRKIGIFPPTPRGNAPQKSRSNLSNS